MNKKILVFGFVFLAVFLAGCPDSESGYASLRSDGQPYSGSGPYDDPNTTYYDTGDPEYSNSSDSEDCGNKGEPCCQYIGTDVFGMITAQNYCNDYLDCRMDICVEGPEYTSYERTENY